MDELSYERLASNLEGVRQRIHDAALAAGRDPLDVFLVAITKNQPLDVIPALLDLGVQAIGENRPEEIWRKAELLAEQAPAVSIPWHLVGHFQRKKIPRTLPLLDAVHSLHSLELLATLDVRVRDRQVRPLPVFLQVNVSREPTKQGFLVDDVEHVVDLVEAFPTLRLAGLMTMTPEEASPDEVHEIFAGLRELAESCGRDRVRELSMGMSGDFEIAVAEGATLVRIGTALFEGVNAAV